MRIAAFIGLILCAAFIGCTQQPVPAYYQDTRTPQERSKQQFHLQHLFDVDGCAVYEFEAEFRERFLTTCPGSVSSEYSVGKGGRREDDTQTVTRP